MEAAIGNLYDINKAAYAKEPKMTKKQIEDKKKELKSYFLKTPSTYYMLLNKEHSDYTIIKITKPLPQCCETAAEEVMVCLTNRGTLVEVEKQDNGAYECWIQRDGSADMYALFPYDAAVIEC